MTNSNRHNIQTAISLPFWKLTEQQSFDLNLILNDAFSPLDSFICESDYKSILSDMRLANGHLWPIPIKLDVDRKFVDSIGSATDIALRNSENNLVAIMSIKEIWEPDFEQEAEAVFGTQDPSHIGVFNLLNHSNPVCLGGTLKKCSEPGYIDYSDYRHTPAQLKQLFKDLGWTKIVAFQTRNPMHFAHIELTKLAMQKTGANLLIHPVVGVTRPSDIDYHTRMFCYTAILKQYPIKKAMLSILPLAMRMAGPREALWHALIRKNYGCTHFIIGRDHASPGKNDKGENFYNPLSAHELVEKYKSEINIEPILFDEIVYDKTKNKYVFFNNVSDTKNIGNISGTKLRRILAKGEQLPDWFTPKEVAQKLYTQYPKLKERGLVIFFTGLPSSGKSTLAKMLQLELFQRDKRFVNLLDGDVVRSYLSSELGFSKEHRSLNVQRIGFVANEIAKNNGIAICACIAPYSSDRQKNRKLINQYGRYIEVFLSTPLKVCEQRDVKGFYYGARENLIKSFTGVNDTYEKPKSAEIVIDTADQTSAQSISAIIQYLEKQELI